jgi:hypothetical protein
MPCSARKVTIAITTLLKTHNEFNRDALLNSDISGRFTDISSHSEAKLETHAVWFGPDPNGFHQFDTTQSLASMLMVISMKGGDVLEAECQEFRRFRFVMCVHVFGVFIAAASSTLIDVNVAPSWPSLQRTLSIQSQIKEGSQMVRTDSIRMYDIKVIDKNKWNVPTQNNFWHHCETQDVVRGGLKCCYCT